MKKILILGGARFHGFLLAEHFSEKGYETYVLNRGNFRKDYGFKVNQLIADRNNEKELKKVLNGLNFDFIIDNNAYNSTQIGIFLSIIKGKFKHYIFTSTVAVYLKLFSDIPIKEEPIRIENGFYPPEIKKYAINKLEAENKIKEFDINYTILRFPNIFGEGDFLGKLTFFNDRFRDDKKVLVEEEVKKFSLIYSGDIPKIYDLILGNEKCFRKIINIADLNPYDYDLFFSKIFDNYKKENLIFLHAEKIHNSGYILPFAFGPLIDVSLQNELIKPSFTPLKIWGKKTLEWENMNLDDNKKQEYRLLREKELKIISRLNESLTNK